MRRNQDRESRRAPINPKATLGLAFCAFLGSVAANVIVPIGMRKLGSDTPSLWVLALLLQLVALFGSLKMWCRLIRHAGVGYEPASCLCAILLLTVATLVSFFAAVSVVFSLFA